MTSSERNLGHRWFEEVWNKGRREAVAEMFMPDTEVHDGEMTVRGPEGFYALYDRLKAALPDMHVKVEDSFAEGDKLCVRWTCTATYTGEGLGFPATNRRALVTGICILRVANGKVAECWQNWDMLGMYEQFRDARSAATYIR